MKRTKKFVSLLLAMVMAFAMAVTAYADEPGTTPTAPTAPEGSITIKNNENVSVAGKTFNAYKILDVEIMGTGTDTTYVYTIPDELKRFYAAYYSIEATVGDFDYQVVKKIEEEKDLFAFAAAALKAAKGEADTRIDSSTGIETEIPGADPAISSKNAAAGENATEVTISKLPLGYYVVEDAGTATPISALILDTTTPDVTVEIKADKPSLDKKIDGNKDTDDSTTGDVSYNNAAVGDSVPFKLTSKVPDMTGYTKYYFVVNDTLSKGLNFQDDVVITVGDKTLVKDTDYTVNTITYTEDTAEGPEKVGTTDIEIVFKNFIQYKELKEDDKVLAKTGSAITVTYTAIVNNDAVIGVEGNENTATLTYSNNPNVKDNGTPENPDKPTPDSPFGETPDSETRTYVTGLELIKIDPQKNRLTGAEFKLDGTKLNTVLVRKETFEANADGEYWKLKDGSYTATAPIIAEDETDTSRYYESTTVKYAKKVTTTPIVKEENVSYTGTVGEDGVLIFDGLAAGTYTITEIKAPAGYNLLEDPITVTIGFTVPEQDETNCKWTYTGTDKVNGENTNQITVTNQAGKELPSTGGMGTKVFYVLGFILVAGAAVLLITKRRMSAEE